MHITHHLIPVAGGDEIWAEDTGGDGTPLVLLHPGVGDSRIWDRVVERLTPDHRVIRYDVRGYGRSPAPTTSYTLLTDLVTVLDHFGLGRVPLVGCSMGGAASLALAVTAPERVGSLVLVTPGVGGYPWPDEPEVDEEYEQLVDRVDVQGLTAFGLREWARSGQDTEAREQMRSAANAWITEAEYEGEDPPVFDRLGEITVPAVVMIGEVDRPTMVECNERIAESVPGCRTVRMPGVDHLAPLRVPDLIAETIRSHSV
ncbi:alpha/beta hydrolase [Streptomyces sp. NPDC000594]|uniref:alpha/beta fold hydrolase n=1 Tax=Streptomyces sp. NPDC000594 TaxID=3154261 RepID=UPI00332CFE83